jgi:diacylglycerol kinase family enzyme
VRTWTRFKAPLLNIRIGDTDSYSGHAWLASVANCRQFGNNATIAPQARIDDGLLNLTLLRKPFPTAIPALLQKLFTARIDTDGSVYCATAPSFVIQSDEDMDAHVDGEHIRLGKTATVKLEGSLNLWC